jgi:hypothetical protein
MRNRCDHGFFQIYRMIDSILQWSRIFFTVRTVSNTIIKTILCSHKHKKKNKYCPDDGRTLYTPNLENVTIHNTTPHSSQSLSSESVNIAPHAPIDTLRLMRLMTRQYDITLDDLSLSVALFLALIYFFFLPLQTPRPFSFTRFIWKSYQLFPRKSPGRTDRLTDKQTDRQTDRQKDRLMTLYPPPLPLGGGGIKGAIKSIPIQTFKTYLNQS